MAASNEKGSIHTEIGQDVIDAAVRSVERRMDESEDGETTLIDVPVPETVSDEGDSASLTADAPAEPAAAPPAATPEEVAVLRQEIDSLKAQLEFSQAKGREVLEKLKDAHERAKESQERTLRAAADLENYRKRAQKEKEEVQKFGAEKLLKDLLPVIDNLDRALEAATKTPDLESFQKGVAMTRKSFEDTLGRHGVKSFSAKGQPFDPRVHEAIQQVETSEVPVGHVVHEVVRGFHLNDRLVRPALVVVARAPAVVEPPPPAAAPVTEAAPAPSDTPATAASEQDPNTPGGSP